MTKLPRYGYRLCGKALGQEGTADLQTGVSRAKGESVAFPSIQLQLSRKAVFSPCASQLHDSISVQS